VQFGALDDERVNAETANAFVLQLYRILMRTVASLELRVFPRALLAV
jgi:hypothetical protein